MSVGLFCTKDFFFLDLIDLLPPRHGISRVETRHCVSTILTFVICVVFYVVVLFSLGILSTKTANNATGDERDSDIISIFSGEYALTISSTTPLGFWATRIRKLSPGDV